MWPYMSDIYPYTDLHNINLGWVLKTVKWCEKRVKDLTAQLEELDKKVDSNYNDLKGLIASTDQANRSWTANQISKQIELLNAELSAAIAQLQVALTVGYKKGDAHLAAWLTVELQKLYESIPKLSCCTVVNPVTGQQSSIQQAINDLWQTLRYGGLTATEYALWGLTADEYAAKGMTAGQYALYARFPWKKDLNLIRQRGKMPDPVSGEWTPVWRVVNWLSSLHRINGPTADEYAALGLRAEEYKNYNLTAYEYAWEGIPKLYLEGCVTAQQYEDCDLTADDYSAYDMTAYEYATHSLYILPVNS